MKTVLFDLDGTLLPMDQDHFVKAYFGGLATTLVPYGYDPNALIQAIWSGTKAMIQNDGRCTNESVFWNRFASHFDKDVRRDEPLFETFYRNEFQLVRAVCGFAQDAARTIAMLKEKGCRVVLATNPIFPAIATHSRIRWAGLQPEDFEWITTYENSSHCKPNIEYYRDILAQINERADNCIMVGNDVDEDMIARELGMDVFLLTDCLINRDSKDLTNYPKGGFRELMTYLKAKI